MEKIGGKGNEKFSKEKGERLPVRLILNFKFAI
jgi:hypothetical protein